MIFVQIFALNNTTIVSCIEIPAVVSKTSHIL